MDNSMATKPYSKLKGDPYRAYEALPGEVRLALQEALVDWCPLRAREWHLHLLRQQRLRPAQAASLLVQTIRRQDQAEVTSFARTWPKGAQAYPHLAAGATLQRYAGPEGMPAPPPLPPAAPRPKAPAPTAPAQRSKAPAQRSKAPAKRSKAQPQTSKAPAKRPKAVAKGKAARRARR
ncbi:MAG TPA: DUF6525 family protein [Roseococcus sp.]|nr:DUF6525 family protein [Roseococcus sp.]